MKISIKQYEYEKIEVESKEIRIPTETTYYFETGIRRSIKIVPIFTTWNKKNNNKEEELYYLDITCLYTSSECFAERFKIYIKDIEKIYYSEKDKHKEFITSLVEDWFDKRTKQQWEEDFKYFLLEIQKDN